jgi:uncharacterized phiE125 gp8 family phage protein
MKTTIQNDADFLPISIDEAKAWCRIDTHADDALISGLIVAATHAAEAATGRTITPTTVEYSFPACGRRYRVPTSPVVEVSEVGLRNCDGYTILSTDDYTVGIDDLGASVVLSGACSARSSVVVTADTGYADAASVPQLIKQAIAVHVGSAYAGREGQDTAAATFQNLLRPLIVSVL